MTPWDIYIDERKVPGDSALGFLVVPNTASFSQKLFRCRHMRNVSGQARIETREIHWSNIHRGVIDVCERWIDRLYQHKGAKFYVLDWDRTETKEQVILRFLARFTRNKRLEPPFDVVVFLDYDSSHARAKIQNVIRESGRISRCYHLDSSKNDCIQCCDLLLGACTLLRDDPTIRFSYSELEQRKLSGDKLKNSEVRRYLCGILAKTMDSRERCVYDLRKSSR